MLTSFLTVLLLAAPGDDTRNTVSTMYETFAQHDPARAHALFTADATVTVVIDSRTGRAKAIPDELYVGPDALRDFLDAYLPGWSGAPKKAAVDDSGTRATVPGTIESDRFDALGVYAVEATLEVEVRNSRIRSLTITPSPEASARLVAEVPAGNKARVRSYVDRINARDYSALDDIVARSFDQHSFMPMAPGSQGLKDFYKEFSRAFPDFKFTVEEAIAEGDIVAVRMTARYTHKGEYLGIAPTNKAVTVTKFDFFRFAGGKCVAHWDSVDRLGLLQQLGVVPQVPRWSATPGYEGFR